MSADKGFLSVKKQNGDRAVLEASKHNKRKLPSHPGATPALSHLNYSLRGPETPEQVAALAKKKMADVGINKLKRKDAITAIEFVASLPVGSTIDSSKYFREFVEFIEHRFGAQNMLSADVHLDESAPHCHILISSLDGNKLNGAAIIGNKTKLSDLNACFYADVASKYGISRSLPRLSGNSRRDAAKLVRDRLNEDADPVMVSSVRSVVLKLIDQSPEPFMEALDIQRPALVKPVKTFKQIATGTGKGPTTEAGQASRDRHLTRSTSTPIVVGGGSDARPLSCVGVAQFIPLSSSSQDHPERHRYEQYSASPLGASEYTRTYGSDEDSGTWVCDEGEYIKPPSTATSTQKVEAGRWRGEPLLADRSTGR